MNPLPHTDPVAVVGLGLLGRGIAASLLGHGFRVVAVEPDEAQRTRAGEHIASMIEEMIDLGGANPSLRNEWLTRYASTPGFELLQDCTFVVESVTEDPAIKRRAFESIEAVVAPNVVIASNTSSIPISQLQQGLKHPARLVGMHWAEPAHATRFMELIRGAQTSAEALETAAAIARRLEKEPCICQHDIPAFIVNRISYAMYREALHLLESGVADAETIDLAVRNALGLWASICGPFRWIDLSGGPEIYARTMQRVFPTLSKANDIPASLQKLAESGARGTASGRGFFHYTPEEARHWDDLYRRNVWRVAQLQKEYFPPSPGTPP
jgi:3-hydroxybutyryl-CoA dehydrogenase